METKRIVFILFICVFSLTNLVNAQTLSIARLSADIMGLPQIIDYQASPLLGTVKFQKKTLALKGDTLRIVIKKTLTGAASSLSSALFSNSSTSSNNFTLAVERSSIGTDSAVVKIVLSGSTPGTYTETLFMSFNNDPYSVPLKGEIVSVLKGDVNENNLITPFDASSILQHTVGLITLTGNPASAADVSTVGGITALDASYVLQYTVYKEPGFSSVEGNIIVTKPTLAKTPVFELKAGKIEEKKLFVPLVIKSPELLALNVKIWFNSNALKFVDAQKPDLLQDMMWEDNIQDDIINFAAAGIDSKKIDEITILLIFEVIDDSKLEEELVSIENAKVNEINAEINGEKYTLGSSKPTIYTLRQNYPNPFNADTKIEYALPEGNFVKLTIYNMLGQVVWQYSANEQAGIHQIIWNGVNKMGNPVATGVYIYRLEAGKFVQSKKMVLLK